METNKRTHEIDRNANFLFYENPEKKIKFNGIDDCNDAVSISSISNEMVRRIISYIDPRFDISLTCRQFLALANSCGNSVPLELEGSNDLEQNWTIQIIRKCKEILECVYHLIILGNSKRAKEISSTLHRNDRVSRGISIICRLPYGHDADGGVGNQTYPTKFKERLPTALQLFSKFSHLVHIFVHDVNLNFQIGLKTIIRNCVLLKGVSLNGCLKVSNTELGILSSNRNIKFEHLSFEGCLLITDEGLKCLKSVSADLKYLNLEGCVSISSNGIVEMIEHCYKLSYLNLKGCVTTEEGVLRAIKNTYASIENLSLDNSITVKGMKYFSNKCKRLDTLELQSCKFGNFSIKYLANRLKGLHCLNFMGSFKMKDSGIQYLIQNIRRIKKLNLRWCKKITDKSIIGMGYHCRLMEELDIEGCNLVTDNGINTLANYCKLLTYLNASQCKISSNNFPYLSHMLKSIQSLNVKDCEDITNDTLKEFIIECKGLKVLNNENTLSMACKEGWKDEVKILIEHKNLIDAIDPWTGFAPLHEASQHGHLDIITTLITSNANVDIRDIYGCTSLFIASKKGLLNVVSLLIEHNANLNHFNRLNHGILHPSTPIYIATVHSRIEIMRTLINEKADVNLACGNKGYTAMHLSAILNLQEALALLVEHKANLDTRDFDKGFTPINLASAAGNIAVVKILINGNADLDKPGRNGFTPLHTSSGCGYVDIVMELMKAKADINSADIPNGFTPLHIACSANKPTIVNLLIEANANVNCASKKDGLVPLHVATTARNYDIAKILIENNAHIDPRTEGDKFTPLHLACKTGSLQITQLLIENDCDIHLQTSGMRDEDKYSKRAAGTQGTTALHIAAIDGHLDIVSLLLSKNAVINVPNEDGYTPLYAACLEGHEGVVNVLLAGNTEAVQYPTHDGSVPLHAASINGNINIVKALLKNGADVEHENRTGLTPLVIASIQNHVPIVETLIENNASIDKRIGDATVLSAASYKGHFEVVKLLIKHKANVDFRKDDDYLPLRWARQYERDDMVEILQKYFYGEMYHIISPIIVDLIRSNSFTEKK